ncbi:hypothetical protein FD755_007604 [Muntiacus reevesi]|uniref:Uncharacterized protein n=1 Tax=Muntiacus reevesi TaxID=9886 RepID=A0A5J5MI57_MUNRE|nr:hypothetical protein FD755_007604 [Muntiacus reevesi]
MRIIFASAQMVWSNCWGAGCDYGLTQSEVEIWQPSSLFDLCRQLKENPSGFKVQKDVYADQTSRAVVRSALQELCLCFWYPSCLPRTGPGLEGGARMVAGDFRQQPPHSSSASTSVMLDTCTSRGGED